MTIFYTVATLNYLPQAITLLDSVKQYHPEFNCVVGLVDFVDNEQWEKYTLLQTYPVIQLHELNAESFSFITATYSPNELSNCSKILFAEYFFKQQDVQEVFFCDSDMLFFEKIPLAANERDIIITPHFISPPPLEFKTLELEVINSGLYNAGFFRLRKAENTMMFIQWLKERSIPHCVDDRCNGLYFDQTWYNFIPLYFKNVHIETNKGCNVAYWNLHERHISSAAGKYYVNEQTPLIFFHFSGWSMQYPDTISRFQHRYTIESRPDVLPLLQLYKALLQKNQYETYHQLPCHYVQKIRQQEIQKPGKFRQLLKKLKG